MICPICRSGSRLFFEDGDYAYRQCMARGCRHTWLSAIPPAHVLQAMYDEADSRRWNTGGLSMLHDYQANPDAVRRYYYRDRIRAISRVFRDVIQPGIRALDIGCGPGAFCAVLRDYGLKTAGQDLNSTAVRIGRKALKIDLRDDSLDAFEGEEFDLITSYDVIEHVSDPVAFAQSIRGILKAGGALVVRTPNHASWLRLLTGRRWLWYMPPAHLNLFTPGSLRRLLTESGFRVDKIRTGASTYLYFAAYYVFGASRVGTPSLNMPRWRELAVFGIERALRLILMPILLPLRLARADAVIEVYATAVTPT